MSEFDLIAPFYDLEYGDLLEDIPFYINFARSTGSPILELGVGTGRLLLPLAQGGLRGNRDRSVPCHAFSGAPEDRRGTQDAGATGRG